MTKRTIFRLFIILTTLAMMLTLTVTAVAIRIPTDPLSSPPTITNFVVIAGSGARTTYKEGEIFDKTGFIGKLTYSDNRVVDVPASDMTVSLADPLKPTDTHVYFRYGSIATEARVAITVIAFSSLEIITQPSKVDYYATESFDATGLTLRLVYTDSSTVGISLSSCTLSVNSDDPLMHDMTKITVTYTLGTHSVSSDINITVKPITSLTVTTPPTTVFHEGDVFNDAGIAVMATYDDGHTIDVTRFCEYPNATDPLVPAAPEYDSTTLTVECDGTSVQFDIDVDGIASFLVTPDTAKDYYYGDVFSKEGIVITAVFADASTKDVTDSVTFTYPVLIGPNAEIYATYLTHRIDADALHITLHEAIQLNIVVKPTKTEYNAGETFDPAGLVVTVKYDNENGTEKTLTSTDYTITVNDPLVQEDYRAVVGYYGLEANIDISVIPDKPIKYIEITSPPDNLKYVTNQGLSIDGMFVSVHYSDGTNEFLDNSKLIISPEVGTPVTPGITFFTVTYKLSETVQYSAKQPIEVAQKEAVSLTIIKKPNKIVYNEGEKFSATGLVVNAVYNDGTNEQITSYTVSPTDAFILTDNNETVVNIYIKYGNSECVLPVTVKPKAVKSITIQMMPTKTSYLVGETFSTEGMLITLTYADNTIGIVKDDTYGWGPTGALSENDKAITVTYRGLSAQIAVTVTSDTPTTTGPVDSNTEPIVTTGPETPSSTVDPGVSSAPIITNAPVTSAGDPATSTTSDPSPSTTRGPSGGKNETNPMIILWIAILAIIIIALVVLIVYYKKNFT